MNMKHPSRFNPALWRLSTCPIAEQILAGSSPEGELTEAPHLGRDVARLSSDGQLTKSIHAAQKRRAEQNKWEQEEDAET